MNGLFANWISLADRPDRHPALIHALPELLGKSNDDALRAADEAQPVHVLILGDFAYQPSAMSTQACEDVIVILDGEHDAPYAKRIRRRVLRLSSDRRRTVELRELDRPVAIWRPQQGDLASDVVQADDLVHPASFDLRLALQLHAKFDTVWAVERFLFGGIVDSLHAFAKAINQLDRHSSAFCLREP